MSSKHTPGPWIVCNEDAALGWRRLSVCSTVTRPSGRMRIQLEDRKNANFTPEVEANARLIAAAPEMLETLMWIRDQCTGLPAVARALADKVISKAEGAK